MIRFTMKLLPAFVSVLTNDCEIDIIETIKVVDGIV